MNNRRSSSRRELMSRLRDLREAERRRHTSPRGSPEYRAALAAEERDLELVWRLIERSRLDPPSQATVAEGPLRRLPSLPDDRPEEPHHDEEAREQGDQAEPAVG